MSKSDSGSEPEAKKSKRSNSVEKSEAEKKLKSSRENSEENVEEGEVKEAKRSRRSKSVERNRRRRDSSSPEVKKSRRSRRSGTPDRFKQSKRRSRSRGRRKYKDLDKPEEEYQRYYGDDKKENNDRYWSKYPKRDENVVGTRYYDVEEPEKEKEKVEDKSVIPARQRKTVDLLTSKTGGAYIPPAKLRLMQAEITDKSSAAYQRIAWEALKKSIHGHINKINTSNLAILSRELLHENIVRGRGLLCKSIIQAQAASPTFTNVYAALVAVINSKFPNIGELLLKRLVLQFKRGFKQNNKVTCISAATFIAHLVNQCVAHEILALEILTLLVESPTDDSVEVAIAFLKECGQKLTEVSSKGINAIFEMLRNILHEGQLEKRIQYMIEVMFQVRKDGFKDHAAVIEELDVVDEENQFTHLITLDDVKQNNSEDVLNVFKFDDNYEENEGKYKALSKDILDTDSSGSDSAGESGSEEDSDEEGEENDEQKTAGTIIDNTETNLIILRRLIYLTIQSSLDFEECAHKLMKMELKPGQEIELCHMFLDCCAEQRTYEKFYGLLAQRFCQINKVYVGPFEQIFKDTYATTHRLDANRLRNVSKFFGHLLFTDAIGWEVMEAIRLNEQDTNSSSRIFIKILFQELAEYMGLGKLNARLKDPTMQGAFSGLFPRDNPKNTRFAINFFTTIGLGGLTDELREHLTAMPKVTEVTEIKDSSASSSSSSSSDSDSSSSSSSTSTTSDSSSSDDEKSKKKRKKLKKTKRVEDKKSKVDEEKEKSRKRDVDRKRKDEKTFEDRSRKMDEDRFRKNDEDRFRKEDEDRYRKKEDGYRKNDESRYRRKEDRRNEDKYGKMEEERVRKKNEDFPRSNLGGEEEQRRRRRNGEEDKERVKDRQRSSRHEKRREEKVDRRHESRRS